MQQFSLLDQRYFRSIARVSYHDRASNDEVDHCVLDADNHLSDRGHCLDTLPIPINSLPFRALVALTGEDSEIQRGGHFIVWFRGVRKLVSVLASIGVSRLIGAHKMQDIVN